MSPISSADVVISYINKVETTLFDTCLCFKSAVTTQEMSSELLCTEPFDFTLQIPCIYAAKAMPWTDVDLGNTPGYDVVRDEISSVASCFTGVSDCHYSGCDTGSPTLSNAAVLVSSTGSDTSLTYTTELEVRTLASALASETEALRALIPSG